MGGRGWRQHDSPQISLQDTCAVTARSLCSGVSLPTGVGDTTALLDVARLGFFIEEKILYSFTVRVTRMENITSSIYDVISKGKVASAFFFYSN